LLIVILFVICFVAVIVVAIIGSDKSFIFVDFYFFFIGIIHWAVYTDYRDRYREQCKREKEIEERELTVPHDN